MKKKELEHHIPKFRAGAISLKDFYKMHILEKNAYMKKLIQLPKEELCDVDKFILEFYAAGIKPVNNFISI